MTYSISQATKISGKGIVSYRILEIKFTFCWSYSCAGSVRTNV